MDAIGSAPDSTVDQRAQIRGALQKHAPALVDRYEAAVRLVQNETFPWRLRLVAHAVREIANALPEELLGLKAGRDSDALLEDVTRTWERDVSPSALDGPRSGSHPQCGAGTGPASPRHSVRPASSRIRRMKRCRKKTRWPIS
jgi:hypothetical protein